MSFPISTATSESYTTTDLMSCSRTHQQGKPLADSVAAAHAAGRSPLCTRLLPVEASIPCSTKVIEGRLWYKKTCRPPIHGSRLLSVRLCLNGGVPSTACDTAAVDNCQCDTFDNCKDPTQERIIKIKLVSCAP